MENDLQQSSIFSDGEVKNKPAKSPKHWTPPPAGFVKLNCDASLSLPGKIGAGAVIRNADGDILLAGVRNFRGFWPAVIAEGRAILYGLNLAKSYGLKNIVVESDSKILIDRLAAEVTYFSDLDNVLDDIMLCSKSFDFISWCHVKRDGNYVAHHLAKIVTCSRDQTWENCCPPEVSSYVLMDKLSLN